MSPLIIIITSLPGGGTYDLEATRRDEKKLIPKGVDWIHDFVSNFNPDNNSVTTANGDQFTYDYLVVAAGIQLNWGDLPGLQETIGKNGVTSN